MVALSFLMVAPVAAQASPVPNNACKGNCAMVQFWACFPSGKGDFMITYVWIHGTHFAGPRYLYKPYYSVDWYVIETVHVPIGSSFTFSYDIVAPGYGPYTGVDTFGPITGTTYITIC
jgi:hypothetical protein